MTGLSDFMLLCPTCQPWADEIGNDNMFVQRRIGRFSEKYGHRQVHDELERLVKIKRKVWASLEAFIEGKGAP